MNRLNQNDLDNKNKKVQTSFRERRSVVENKGLIITISGLFLMAFIPNNWVGSCVLEQKGHKNNCVFMQITNFISEKLAIQKV